MYKIIFLSVLFIVLSCNTKSSQGIQTDKQEETIKAVKASDSVKFDFESKITEFRKQLSPDFIYKTYSSFLVISNLSETETQKSIDNTIASAEECFYNDYFEKKPDEITTIFLFKDDETYRYWAKRLFGDTDLSRFGYYKPSKKTMLMNINTGGGTLVHELTHAFVRYDFPDIPSWFNEGLGSLYERCSMNNKIILGHTNWRLPELQSAIASGTYTSLDLLVNMSEDDFYGYESSLNYAQARYLCQYLQQKNILKKFYKTFRDNFSRDTTGKTFLEEITKMKIDVLDEDYLKWIKSLKYSE